MTSFEDGAIETWDNNKDTIEIYDEPYLFPNNNSLIHNYSTLEVSEKKGMYFENLKLDDEIVVDTSFCVCTNEVDHHKNIGIKGAVNDLKFTKSTIKGEILLNDLIDKLLGTKGKVVQTLTQFDGMYKFIEYLL